MLIGFWFARKPVLAAIFDPYVKAANSLPRVVLAPIFALWLGLGIWSKVALGVSLVFFIVFFNVYQGVKEVNQTVLSNARMLGMNERQLLRNVYLPSALSWMFSSLHTAVGFAVVGAVVGEYLGSSAGLGYLIHQAEGVFDVTGVFAGMFVLTAFVLLIDWVVSGRGTIAHLAAQDRQRERRLRSGASTYFKEEGHEFYPQRSVARRSSDGNSQSRNPSARLCPDASATPEKPELMFGVGGKPLFYYLPLTIAERKGFFKEEGLSVTVNDFGGGAKSLQALIGGSVDVVTGAYEHTIRMQNRGQDIKAICELGQFPGICIAVRKDLANDIKTIADLKGQNVGVTAPGSSTSLFLQYALIKNGRRLMTRQSSVSAAAPALWQPSRRVKSPP